MAYDFFYDEQLRRFLTQIVRAFTGFQYQIPGKNGNPPELLQVPCRLASQNRQVGQIMRNNSENAMLTVPMITIWLKEMNMARDRTQAPGFVSSVQITEREFDNTTGAYSGAKGNSYTVDRVMPHPLDLSIQVDIWTSNELQKHQLWEQIYMAFNVGFDIQSSENPADWSALSSMTMESMTWSSRSIPIGVSDEIDVASFTFKLPVWINPPAKLKQQKLIHQIVANLYSTEDDIDRTKFNDSDTSEGPSHSFPIDPDINPDYNIISSDNTKISIENGNIMLLDENGNQISWIALIEKYGVMRPTISSLHLRAHIDAAFDLDIIGSIQYTANPNVLQWTIDIDTLPANTLLPVDAIIDPLLNFPNQILSPPTNGQRYLIINDIRRNMSWSNFDQTFTLSASAGDIIQYTNGIWVVAFSAARSIGIQFLLNLKTSKQLKFLDGAWIMAIEGEYNPGFWRLRL